MPTGRDRLSSAARRGGAGAADLDDPEPASLHAWAVVHGLAMLILDHRVEWDETMVEKVVGLTFGVAE